METMVLFYSQILGFTDDTDIILRNLLSGIGSWSKKMSLEGTKAKLRTFYSSIMYLNSKLIKYKTIFIEQDHYKTYSSLFFRDLGSDPKPWTPFSNFWKKNFEKYLW